ncbi:phosphatase 2C-domain-containing protein [Tribonema minus]|uniref:Phosphatase 2C-domain-containing protein n=1 Tax=Tribonema minus TaxID=303371 RepID=A0A836CEF9_9STRA|nr:phosphatase 2C-domain-containing protein [Tribonema minus]
MAEQEDRFEMAARRLSSNSLITAEVRQANDMKDFLRDANPGLFAVAALPLGSAQPTKRVRVEVLPARDLTLTAPVAFELEMPRNYPLVPPTAVCVSDTPDTQASSAIDGATVTLALLRDDIAFWSRSYQLDVVAHALRRLFLRADLAPWQLCETVLSSGAAAPPHGPLVTCGGHHASVGGRDRMEDAAAMQPSVGGRDRMEDAAAIKEGIEVPNAPPGPPRGAYYAVFDGHGGDACAQFAAAHFGAALAEAAAAAAALRTSGGGGGAQHGGGGGAGGGDAQGQLWARALWSALRETDDGFCKAHIGRGTVGATATVAVFDGGDSTYTTALCALTAAAARCRCRAAAAAAAAARLHVANLGDSRVVLLHVANLGDSRVVLCRGGNAIELTYDCKAGRSDEIARIVALGGFVSNARVRGQLAVSRALGDTAYKEGGQMLVSNDAELCQVQLSGDDEFFIVACDGLWDVVDSEDAVGFVQEKIAERHAPCMEDIARELVTWAVEELGARDNVSATVVRILPADSPLVAAATQRSASSTSSVTHTPTSGPRAPPASVPSPVIALAACPIPRARSTLTPTAAAAAQANGAAAAVAANGAGANGAVAAAPLRTDDDLMKFLLDDSNFN